MTLLEYEQFEEEYDVREDEEELEEEEEALQDLGPDEGECLVVRRALSGAPMNEEDLQREAIFHTPCTV